MKIGFVGSGSMAAAMARGLARSESVDAELAFSDSGSGRAAELAAETGGERFEDNAALASACDVLLLAVKPAQLEQVATEIAASGKPVVSLLGATSLGRLGEVLPGTPLVRVMPNVGVEARQGVLCYAVGPGVEPAQADEILAMLAALGETVEMPDQLMDGATAVMGCSPAYVALLCETLIEAAEDEGIGPAEARKIVVETLRGTAALLHEHEAESVRRAVASPGGSTEAGLEALERGEFKRVLGSAVHASLEKMRG